MAAAGALGDIGEASQIAGFEGLQPGDGLGPLGWTLLCVAIIFLGSTLDFYVGKALGLSEDWVVKAIKASGNYGEMWERNIKPLGLPRGLNSLWNKGGIMFAPPIR